MKSSGGNIVRGHYIDLKKNGDVKFVQSKDGELYGKPRKSYIRTHPYPNFQFIDDRIVAIRHFHALPREKTTIIQLRRLGSYSINMLSKASGRSTSWIHKVLSDARRLGLLRKIDNRKLPRRSLLLGCRKRMVSLLSWMKLWQPFIFGEDGEPP